MPKLYARIVLLSHRQKFLFNYKNYVKFQYSNKFPKNNTRHFTQTRAHRSSLFLFYNTQITSSCLQVQESPHLLHRQPPVWDPLNRYG